MIKQIVAGYKRSLTLLAKVLFLLAGCFLIGFFLVYPLWAFAVTQPSLYTVCVLGLLVVLGIVLLERKIGSLLRGARNGVEKRTVLWNFCASGAKIISILAGVCGFVYFVVQDAKIVAIVWLFAALLLHGVFAYGTRKTGGS
ncbi:MAG: hypothetical protein LBS64_02700 [Spirochaetaceae bacterium]|jgi:hypothetical protein|nr:hypothetical protein [Spirochaetaceae bacterium]